jgi:hypothetical protein
MHCIEQKLSSCIVGQFSFSDGRKLAFLLCDVEMDHICSFALDLSTTHTGPHMPKVGKTSPCI